MSTIELANNWLAARKIVESLEAKLQAAQGDLRTASNALGQHLAPKNLGIRETIAIWVRFDDHDERLIQVSKNRETNNYIVEVRDIKDPPKIEESGMLGESRHS